MKERSLVILFLFFIPSYAKVLLIAGSSSGIHSEGTNSPLPTIVQIDGLGNGYSSPAVTENLIYVTGEFEGMGYVQAFDWDGKLIWRDCYGPEWTLSFRGTRAAPVVDQSCVYVCSGLGFLICYHALTGEKIWSVDLINDLKGENVAYGYSMPILIDESHLYCSPGGYENNVVALDKRNGDIIWQSPGVKEKAGYGKPLVIQKGALKILMTFSEFTFLGINAGTGEVLWTHALNFKGELPCNPPIYFDHKIYIAAGPGNGAIAFQLSPDGQSIKEIWKNPEFDPFFGGFVLVDDYLVGSVDSKGSYVSIDRRTGKIKSGIKFGRGASVLAGNMIAAYNQRGRVGLLELKEEKLRTVTEFTVSEGTGEHFAVPVIYRNRMFIRHGNTLLAFQLPIK